MPLDEPEVIQDNPSVQSIVNNHLDYVWIYPWAPGCNRHHQDDTIEI